MIRRSRAANVALLVSIQSLPEQDRFTRLRTERKHFVDTIKMIAYRAETSLASLLREHLVRSDEAVAMRPMTLEEAIKEAHFRDRDVFVFRDPKGKVMILHRTRDGKMELIEAP